MSWTDPAYLVPAAGVLPLTVAVPLFAAALVVSVHRLLPRWALDGLTLLSAAAVGLMALRVLLAAAHAPVVAWMGGWTPVDGYSVGIALVPPGRPQVPSTPAGPCLRGRAARGPEHQSGPGGKKADHGEVA